MKKKEYDVLYEDFLKLKEEIEKSREEVEELKSLLEKANMLKLKKTYEEALNLQKV